MSEEEEGYLYCFTNPSMPGQVKVGMTKRPPYERLAEANKPNTWCPSLFKMEFAKKVRDVKHKEKKIHELLEKHAGRANPRREFFNVSPNDVLLFFDLIDGVMWKDEGKKDNGKGKDEQLTQLLLRGVEIYGSKALLESAWLSPVRLLSNGQETGKCVPIGSFYIKKRQQLLDQSLTPTQKLAIYESLTQNNQNITIRDNLHQYLSMNDPIWKKQNKQVLAKLHHLKKDEQEYLLAHFEKYGWFSECLLRYMDVAPAPAPKKLKKITIDKTLLLTKLNEDWDILTKDLF